MGNFASLYSLAGGEQLLVLLIEDQDTGPTVQYVTEVHGEMVTASVPLLDPADRGDHLKRLSAKEEARQMIGSLDDETVKEIRRRFVRDMAGGGEESSFPKEEIVS